jgi:hypothetical protein
MSEGDRDRGFRRGVPQFVIFAEAAGPVATDGILSSLESKIEIPD